MSFFSLVNSRKTLALGLVVAGTVASSSASAQGFFDQLFGGGTIQPHQPSYSYQPQMPMSPVIGGAPIERRHANIPHKKKVVVAKLDETPVRQTPTDLWHDKTLHRGDAIMMKDGLHVYNGPQAAKHTAKQFVPLDRARVIGKTERSALLAMDTTRNDPLRKGAAMDTIASGRSAAVATPISQGIRITDARGASIRYVGP